jgi:hypothetical protein
MKKESLSVIIIKTLLAVVIFTGIGTIIIGGGYLIGDCYKGGVDNKIEKEEIKDEKTIQDETADWETYRNEEYGFEFQYPKGWGEIWENKYKDKYLVAIKFIKTNDVPTDAEISPADALNENDFNFRDCNTILKNGDRNGNLFPDNCETRIISGKELNISTYINQRKARSSYFKEAQILTKKGILFFEVYDKNLFNEFDQILFTFKFIEK